MTVKSISLLGSTGSIGKSTIKVTEELGIRVKAMACNSSMDIVDQVLRVRPDRVGVEDMEAGMRVKRALAGRTKTEIEIGPGAAIRACVRDDVDTVVNAAVGGSGLLPTIAALERGMDVRLANKETLVIGGAVVTATAKEHNAKIIAIDSEHAAVTQCLAGNEIGKVSKVVLTMSGGALRNMKLEELRDATPEKALEHPNWNMGKKITIDCATGMNKAFEMIEAMWLFDLPANKVDAILHPQSLVHAIVTYSDGNELAHLSLPDMRHAIQYSLTYPGRAANALPKLSLVGKRLEFEEIDVVRYKPLGIVKDVMWEMNTMPAVLNGANDELVKRFLNHEIKFTDIADITEEVLLRHKPSTPTLENVIDANIWAGHEAAKLAKLERKETVNG
ncbi:MAG: 1-deoxy-D-xylulose-5-phosphate reductoisomerase [Candidatus Micrarchaeota archaeon]|nr:1-deoxy-D-xylulose-5-phosphate reductoisomerase [Candidatus Micrarchaeota archaeon]